MAKSQPPLYGGQAVIEGVMFAGQKVHVTAIRRKDRSIEYFVLHRKPDSKWLKVARKIPFVRGIVAIIEATANGAKHMNFASERFDTEPGSEEESGSSSLLFNLVGVAIIGVLSFLVAKVIFTAIPAVLAALLDPWVHNLFLTNLIEGCIKASMLILYLWIVGKTPMVRRLFGYHGAEHKVINAFEAGLPLTVQNVRAQSRLHYRCGSSFLIFTVLVGVVIYSFFPYETIWERVLDRLLLLPVVIGVAYEVLRLTNSLRDMPVLRYLGYPGLWLQLLTTKEPSDGQIEVSIAAFQRMLELDATPAAGQASDSTSLEMRG